jgi:hypothetical protein
MEWDYGKAVGSEYMFYLINFLYKIHSELTHFSYQDNCILRKLIRKNTPAALGYQTTDKYIKI